LAWLQRGNIHRNQRLPVGPCPAESSLLRAGGCRRRRKANLFTPKARGRKYPFASMKAKQEHEPGRERRECGGQEAPIQGKRRSCSPRCTKSILSVLWRIPYRDPPAGARKPPSAGMNGTVHGA